MELLITAVCVVVLWSTVGAACFTVGVCLFKPAFDRLSPITRGMLGLLMGPAVWALAFIGNVIAASRIATPPPLPSDEQAARAHELETMLVRIICELDSEGSVRESTFGDACHLIGHTTQIDQ